LEGLVSLLVLARAAQNHRPTFDPIARSIHDKIANPLGGHGAYWDLTEASGSPRLDHANGYATLSEGGGSVSTTTGPRGGADLAATFAGSRNLLFSSSSGDDVDVPAASGSFTVFGWGRFSSSSGTDFFISRWNAAGAGALAYDLSLQSGTLYGQVGSSVGNYINAPMTPPATNTWHFFVITHDVADSRTRLSVNNGTPSVSLLTGQPNPQAQYLCFGSGAQTTLYATHVDVSRWGYIKGALLTSDEIDWLIDSGAGRDWSEIKSLAVR
jgi:hypothetical protein